MYIISQLKEQTEIQLIIGSVSLLKKKSKDIFSQPYDKENVIYMHMVNIYMVYTKIKNINKNFKTITL